MKKKKEWFNLTEKSLSALLRGITSNHNGDFYCLNCFHSYSTEKRLEKHEKGCNDHDNKMKITKYQNTNMEKSH